MTLVADTFDRPDAATLGSLETGTSPWTPSTQGDQLGIQNGQAYHPGTANIVYSHTDAGAADGDLSVVVTAGASLGLLLRFIDSNNYIRILLTTAGFVLEKRDAGTFTTLATLGDPHPSGTTYTLTARMDGPDLTISVDGTTKISHTLTEADQAKYDR